MKSLPLPAFVLLSCALGAASAPAKPRSWVALSAKTSAARYVTGQPIDLILTAKNTHSRAAFLHFSSGQRFDVQLFQPGAKSPVYTWSATRMFAQTVGQLRLAAGQSQTFPIRIGDDQGALVPGQYLLRAHLTNSSSIEAPPMPVEVVAAPMKLQVALNQTQLKIGDPLLFTLSLSNTSQTPQRIEFYSGQRFDISILNEDGQTVWNWAANKRFTRSLSHQTLAPGESKTYEAAWDGQPLPDAKIVPGTYSVRAVLTGRPPIGAEPMRIEIK